MAIEGACLCGAVRFALDAGRTGVPAFRWFAYCHCSMCRKQHGALASVSVGIAAEALRWRAGAEEIARFSAAGLFERPFCRRCGSKVPAATQVPGVLNVPAGTLAGDLGGARPRAHIFAASKSPLWTIGDALPRYDEYPPGFTSPLPQSVAPPTVDADGDGAVRGGCLCGAVRYALDAPLERLVHCHCERCRRSTGAACRTVALVPDAGLRFVRGAAAVQRCAVTEGERYETRFCARCGSQLPVPLGGSGAALVPIGSVDTPLAARPLAHVNVGAKAPWHAIEDSLPRFAGPPPADALGARLSAAGV